MATGLGIDVGSESIKVVQVKVSGGIVTVTGALKIPRGAVDQAPTGPTMKRDGMSFSLTEQPAPSEEAHAPPAFSVPESLGEDLKKANLRRSGTLGISGREVVLKYLLTPPMPPLKLKMFIDMEIGGKMGSKQTVDSTYDYKLLNMPTGLRNDLVIMAGMSKNEHLYLVNQAMADAKVTPTRITPSSFGLINAYLRTQTPPPNETVVLVDVGHELMEIAILEENRVYFARSAPGGGKKFTAGIEKILKCGMVKAAEFKHERAKLFAEGEKIPGKQELAFQAVLKEGADNIAGAVRSSVTFCRTQAKLPKLDYHRVILCGGGARLNGLPEYLEKKIGKPVQVLDLSNHLDLRKLNAASAQCFEGRVPDMDVALGLAIIDADPTSFHFSLVPEKVLRKRIFLQKTVYGLAAGVVLAAGLITPWMNSSKAVELQSARADDFAALEKEAKEKKNSFRSKIEENQNLARKVDYYARQTRLGRAYLDLFTKLRAELPPDTQVVFFGPTSEAHAGSSGMSSGSDEGVREITVEGHYDTDTYPGTKFQEVYDALRRKILEIPGVKDVRVEDKNDANPKPGSKEFEFTVVLQDSSKPLKAVNAPAPAASADKTAPSSSAPSSSNPGTPSNLAQKGE